MSNVKTAIDWLEEQFWKPENINSLRLGGKEGMKELFEQAKQIELDLQQERYEQGHERGRIEGYGEGYNDYAEELDS